MPELVTSRNENGDLPLHRAAAFGDIRSVEHLCSPGTIDIHGGDGKTALHHAVIFGSIPLVEFLINHGADVNGGYAHGRRNAPLIAALKTQNYDAVEVLLDHDADPEVLDEEEWRPLHFAAYQGRTALTRRLLDMGCELDPRTGEGATPFFLALDQNHKDITDLLWSRGFRKMELDVVHATGATYAHIAAMRGRLDVVQQLLNLDKRLFSKVDADGDNPLLVASAAGNHNVVDLLLQSGMALKGTDTSRVNSLASAARNGCVRTVHVLLKNGAEIDQLDLYLRTALLWAVEKRRLRTAQSLLKAGADPHVRDAMVRRRGFPWQHVFAID